MKKATKNKILKNCKTIILMGIVVLSLFGCEKELKIRPNDFPPMLVLNGVVEQDSLFKINVSRTGGLNESFLLGDLFVTDAAVKLFDGDVFLETMQHDSLGFYSSTCIAQKGHKYSIKVEKGDYPIAVANLDFSNMPDFEISNVNSERTDSLFTYDIPEPGGEIVLMLFKINFDLTLSDNGDENNFYSFLGYTKRQQIIHIHYNGEEEYVELSDFKYDEVGIGMVNWSDWNKYNEYYYGTGIMGNPGYSFRAIDDNIFNGQNEAFDFISYFWTSEVSDFTVVVKSYPESVVKYLESVELYQDIYDSPYSEPVNIYSNVENGVGFVCGVPSSKIVFEIE